MEKITIQFQKLSEDAKAPQQLSDWAAGCDLCCTESYLLQPMERHLFKTNVAVHIPQWMYGRVAPRSGLAFKHGIDVMAGVVDADYRWDIGVILINFWSEPVQIEKWERIAQFIIEKCYPVIWEESQNLEESNRAEAGYWSTGRF